MDGYTYMLERNRLFIARARERARAAATDPRPVDGDTALRQRLMALYDQLEGCGRKRTGRSK